MKKITVKNTLPSAMAAALVKQASAINERIGRVNIKAGEKLMKPVSIKVGSADVGIVGEMWVSECAKVSVSVTLPSFHSGWQVVSVDCIEDTCVIENDKGTREVPIGVAANFTGVMLSGKVMMIVGDMQDLSRSVEGFKVDPDEFHDGDLRVDKVQYITAVVMCVDEYGWTSSKDAQRGGKGNLSTAKRAIAVIKRGGLFRGLDMPPEWATDAQKAKAEQVMLFCENIHPVEAGASGYVGSVRECIHEGGRVGGFGRAQISTAASAVNYYNSEVVSPVKDVLNDNVDHVGVIGKRMTFDWLHLFDVAVADDGLLSWYTFFDGEGNIIKWRTKSREDMQLDAIYSGKGTPKYHNVWKGEKRTVITRASLTMIRRDILDKNATV